jgi:precorrin-4 methylase
MDEGIVIYRGSLVVKVPKPDSMSHDSFNNSMDERYEVTCRVAREIGKTLEARLATGPLEGYNVIVEVT